MNRKPGIRRRLGSYDYNRDENPLPDREKMWRKLQKQKLLKEFAEKKRKKQDEFVELDPSRLGSEFGAVFAQLAGEKRAGISSSSPDEVLQYSQKLSADIKWIEALVKELKKEMVFLDELRKWMLGDGKQPLEDFLVQIHSQEADITEEDVPTDDVAGEREEPNENGL